MVVKPPRIVEPVQSNATIITAKSVATHVEKNNEAPLKVVSGGPTKMSFEDKLNRKSFQDFNQPHYYKVTNFATTTSLILYYSVTSTATITLLNPLL